MPHNTVSPYVVPTVRANARYTASSHSFIYLEHIPHRCTASTMQLFHFHDDHAADFGRPIPSTAVMNGHAAPAGPKRRIRPGDLLAVGADVFEVYVIEGYDSIFPYLKRVTA